MSLANDAAWEVRKEAIWAICNMALHGTEEHLFVLMQLNLFQVLSRAMAVHEDAGVLLAVLDTLEKVLNIGTVTGKRYEELLDEVNGVEILEDLQRHPNNQVYHKSQSLIEEFFESNDESDQNMAPVPTETEYSFGFLPSKKLFSSPPVALSAGFSFGNAPANYDDIPKTAI